MRIFDNKNERIEKKFNKAVRTKDFKESRKYFI